MYCSIRDNMLFDNFPTPLDGIRHLGVTAVEVELTPDFEVYAMDSRAKFVLGSDADAEAYRKHLDGMGLEPCSFLTYRDFSVGDSAENIQWVARALELASILEMSNIRIDSAMSRERELRFGERVRLFAEGLGGALERTSGLTVAMGIENHGFQGNNLAFQLNVYKAVGSERLGSTMDTGNFYWRGYPLSEVYGILAILAPRAKHTHLKNIAYPEDLREQTREAGWEYMTHVSPLDEGDIDHAHVLRLLAEAGYKGDICIEDESLHRFAEGEERVKVLERDVAYVTTLIAEMDA